MQIGTPGNFGYPHGIYIYIYKFNTHTCVQVQVNNYNIKQEY